MKDKDKRFYQGFACAISTLIKSQDEPTLAQNIMSGNGVTLTTLIEADVEKYDLDIIKAISPPQKESEK